MADSRMSMKSFRTTPYLFKFVQEGTVPTLMGKLDLPLSVFRYVSVGQYASQLLMLFTIVCQSILLGKAMFEI